MKMLKIKTKHDKVVYINPAQVSVIYTSHHIKSNYTSIDIDGGPTRIVYNTKCSMEELVQAWEEAIKN